MASVLPSLLAAGFLVPYAGQWAIIIVFVVGELVSWVVTKRMCRAMVTCPDCGQSLWDVGTGNFKARRMRIRDDIQACPHCGSPIKW